MRDQLLLAAPNMGGFAMSKSRRKTPVTGITTAESDKSFKRAENRRHRRFVRSVVISDGDLPNPREYGNPWKSDKDGKSRFDPERYPDLMRK
jgi:hypothetical protein